MNWHVVSVHVYAQVLILSSGVDWHSPLCVPMLKQHDVAWLPRKVQHIPPCNKLLVQSPGLAAEDSRPARLQPRAWHKEALCVSGAHRSPWEEAWPHFEWDRSCATTARSTPFKSSTFSLCGCGRRSSPYFLSAASWTGLRVDTCPGSWLSGRMWGLVQEWQVDSSEQLERYYRCFTGWLVLRQQKLGEPSTGNLCDKLQVKQKGFNHWCIMGAVWS